MPASSTQTSSSTLWWLSSGCSALTADKARCIALNIARLQSCWGRASGDRARRPAGAAFISPSGTPRRFLADGASGAALTVPGRDAPMPKMDSIVDSSTDTNRSNP
jgi:hypothetical protein